MKTTVVASWLLAEATRLGASVAPGETPEARDARLGTITSSLATASRAAADGQGWAWTEIAAWALIAWKEESQFDLRVHAGLPHPVWTSDVGRAKCMGQLHQSRIVPPEVWVTLAGTSEEATLQCARYTITVAIAQAKQCGVYLGRRASKPAVAAVFAAYASGGNCKPDERAWYRAERWAKVMVTRPDRSPVPGYRRVLPREIPGNVKLQAERLVALYSGTPEWQAGKQVPVDGTKFLLLVEKHAAGKTGVSVLMVE